MAQGDRRRSGKKVSSDTYGALIAMQAENNEAVVVERQEKATVEIGDFVSELTTAFSYREKMGLVEGEWLADPERAYTDGAAFGTEIRKANGNKLQITLSIDGSESMWTNNIMRHAGPVFIQLDKMLRAAVRDLPEGSLTYAAFAFNKTGMMLPEKFVEKYQTVDAYLKTKAGEKAKNATRYSMYTAAHATDEEVAALVAEGALPKTVYRCSYDDVRSVQEVYVNKKTHHKEQRLKSLVLKEEELDAVKSAWRAFSFRADQTLLTPLFKQIQHWERDNDQDALRLDIILTDGNLEPVDVEQASQVQRERGGRIRTIMLNFLSRESWSEEQMPDLCMQYPVTSRNLTTEIRSAVEDALRDLQ